MLRFALDFAVLHLALGVVTLLLGPLLIGLANGGSRAIERLAVAVIHLQMVLYLPALGAAALFKPPPGTPIPLWALALGYFGSGLLYGALAWLMYRGGAWVVGAV